MLTKKELTLLEAKKEKTIKRMTHELEREKLRVSQAPVADLKALVDLEGELGLAPFPEEDSEAGVFMQPLAGRVPRLMEAAKR